MAIVGPLALTLSDWASRVEDDGKVATIVELLSQDNEILDDALWVEGNLATGHKSTVRVGLPQATWRAINGGVSRSKSTTAPVTDQCAMLEVYSQIDKDLADLNGNTAEFRLSEDMAFLEGMNQQMANGLFYGNAYTNPQTIHGLAPRYNTVNTANAPNAVNVIDGGGTGSTNTSIWWVTWGAQTCHGIFPKGKRGGLRMDDKGTVRALTDANGNPYEGYTTHFKWDTGLCVRDWRYVARIANIDVTTLSNPETAPNLITALIQLGHKMPTAPRRVSNVQKSDTPKIAGPMGRSAIYCDRTIATWLDIQALDKTNVLLRIEEWDGISVTTFRGVPIRTCDAILNTEARVV